jgi:hypothetical protein
MAADGSWIWLKLRLRMGDVTSRLYRLHTANSRHRFFQATFELPRVPAQSGQRLGTSLQFNRASTTENIMIESLQTTVPDILVRLLAAGFIGGLIGFERRAHHKAIGIAGMMLIAIGSTRLCCLPSNSPSLTPLRSAVPFRGFFPESVGDRNFVLVVGNHGGRGHLSRHVRG